MINTEVFKYDVANLKKKTFEAMTLTLIHEIMHAMGWSNSALSYFQDLRKTTTDKSYDETKKTVTLRGKSVTLVTLPSVVKVAKEYFNCDSLEGVELED